MGDILLWFSLWEWVWSYHKSEESSLVFVDSLRSPSRHSLCWLYRLLIPAPSSYPTAAAHWLFQPAGRRACIATSQPSLAEPGRLSETVYFNFFRLFGSFWPRWVWKQLHQQLGSKPVEEVALTSAKGWLQGAGGCLEASTSSASPGAPGEGVQTPGESCWGARFELITS